MTLREAHTLHLGQTLYHRTARNADGSPQRWRVNGQVKRWKTWPLDVRVPLKHGLRVHSYLTQHNLHTLWFTESDALGAQAVHELIRHWSRRINRCPMWLDRVLNFCLESLETTEVERPAGEKWLIWHHAGSQIHASLDHRNLSLDVLNAAWLVRTNPTLQEITCIQSH